LKNWKNKWGALNSPPKEANERRIAKAEAEADAETKEKPKGVNKNESARMPKPEVPIHTSMASSYATIASKPPALTLSTAVPIPEADEELSGWLKALKAVKDVPDGLLRLVDGLRRDMEAPTGVGGFRNGVSASASASASAQQRTFGGGSSGGFRTQQHSQASSQEQGSSWRGRFGASSAPKQPDWTSGRIPTGGSDPWQKAPSASTTSQQPPPPQQPPSKPVGRYQSRFKATGNIEDKILNTVIGNKLNAFTPLTYNDTRDFIYQIIDSGEREFTRDFIVKVFAKATTEDLYCALFAKLIAEIAHKYPVMYEEMDKYHSEFLHVFEDVKEDAETDYVVLVKQKQYRMGYGQFIAELAGLNALEKHQLVSMVTKIGENIWALSAAENKVKTVEEFIDCLVRLTGGLRDRSPVFFKSVKGELTKILGEKISTLIARSSPFPSLSKKGGFGLMDLKEILGA
jgi:hypothetical protein